MKAQILIILIFILFDNYSFSNNNTYNVVSINQTKPRLSISFREILWAVSHPFIAPKVYKLTKRAMHITKVIGRDSILLDINGGRLDAFKHAYWMALLSQEIKDKKAQRLGEIHEQVNYNSYKKDNFNQDSIASAMDLLNNEAGIKIGKNNNRLNNKQLSELIVNNIKKGNMYVIKKDSSGNYLDCDNRIIDLSKEKKWHKRKCLISSK